MAMGNHPVVAVKGVRVGDFGGKTLSTVGSTVMKVNPHDVPDAGRLQAWYV